MVAENKQKLEIKFGDTIVATIDKRERTFSVENPHGLLLALFFDQIGASEEEAIAKLASFLEEAEHVEEHIVSLEPTELIKEHAVSPLLATYLERFAETRSEHVAAIVKEFLQTHSVASFSPSFRVERIGERVKEAESDIHQLPFDLKEMLVREARKRKSATKLLSILLEEDLDVDEFEENGQAAEPKKRDSVSEERNTKRSLIAKLLDDGRDVHTEITMEEPDALEIEIEITV